MARCSKNKVVPLTHKIRVSSRMKEAATSEVLVGQYKVAHEVRASRWKKDAALWCSLEQAQQQVTHKRRASSRKKDAVLRCSLQQAQQQVTHQRMEEAAALCPTI